MMLWLQLNCVVGTIGALDNVELNPSSTTAQGSFHGIGIKLVSVPNFIYNVSEKQDDICLPSPDTQDIHQPLDSHTTLCLRLP